jgi:hypothetical protein
MAAASQPPLRETAPQADFSLHSRLLRTINQFMQKQDPEGLSGGSVSILT